MFYRFVSRRILIHNLSLEVLWWSQMGPELMCSRKCSCRYNDMNLGKRAAMSGRLSESTYEICYLTRSRQKKRRSGTNISTQWDYGFIPLSPQLLQYPRSLTRTANTKIFPITKLFRINYYIIFSPCSISYCCEASKLAIRDPCFMSLSLVPAGLLLLRHHLHTE